jgi:hypothetical protein
LTVVFGHVLSTYRGYIHIEGPSWSWSYGSWIYNYLGNQYLSPPGLWIRIPLRRGVLDTALCDKVTACRWFSPGIPVSSTNKTYRHNINEILLSLQQLLLKNSSFGDLVCCPLQWKIFHHLGDSRCPHVNQNINLLSSHRCYAYISDFFGL